MASSLINEANYELFRPNHRLFRTENSIAALKVRSEVIFSMETLHIWTENSYEM